MMASTYRTPSRVLAAVTVAALMLALAPFSAPAGAQSFIDPNDPCLPGMDVEPASVNDRDEIPDPFVIYVDCAFALGITTGFGDGDFRPSANTRRDDMAAFIVRSLEAAGYDLPAPSDQGFGDIDGNVHEEDIQVLADIGVVRGFTDTRYNPSGIVDRAQMASFLLQAAEYAYSPGDPLTLEPTGPSGFDDVPSSNVHADDISAMMELLGLTVGITEDRYGPNQDVERDEMVTFAIRLVDMVLQVE